MTQQQWIDHWQAELTSILFAGYVTKDTDPAMLFRAMCNDARRLKAKLLLMHDSLKPEVPNVKATVNPTTAGHGPGNTSHVPGRPAPG